MLSYVQFCSNPCLSSFIFSFFLRSGFWLKFEAHWTLNELIKYSSSKVSLISFEIQQFENKDSEMSSRIGWYPHNLNRQMNEWKSEFVDIKVIVINVHVGLVGNVLLLLGVLVGNNCFLLFLVDLFLEFCELVLEVLLIEVHVVVPVHHFVHVVWLKLHFHHLVLHLVKLV